MEIKKKTDSVIKDKVILDISGFYVPRRKQRYVFDIFTRARIHALMRLLEGFKVQPRDKFTEASLSAYRSILEPRGRALTIL